jgi:hypothetical protein
VLTINDIESTLGRLSVRIGTTVTSGDVVWQPFASANLIREFQGGVTSSLLSNSAAIGSSLPNLSSTVSTSSFSTLGQFGVGVAAQVLNTSWVTYLRGDYRHGEYIEGWGVTGGLRYQFVADSAFGYAGASDRQGADRPSHPGTGSLQLDGSLHRRVSGCRLGTHELGFHGNRHHHWLALCRGLLGGGEIGYNYQIGKWVFGVEGDVAWTNAGGARPCPTGFFYDCESSMNCSLRPLLGSDTHIAIGFLHI